MNTVVPDADQSMIGLPGAGIFGTAAEGAGIELGFGRAVEEVDEHPSKFRVLGVPAGQFGGVDGGLAIFFRGRRL